MTQSLFEAIGISLAPTPTTPDEAPAKKTKKAAGGKTIKRQEVTMEAYFPDAAKFEETSRAALKRSIAGILDELTQEALSQRHGMEWIAQQQCVLVKPTSRDRNAQRAQLMALLQELESRGFQVTKDMLPYLPEDYSRPVVALDFETTGLDTRTLYRAKRKQTGRWQLELEAQSKMVDICIAVESDRGFQIPVLHTEEDGVLNFELDIAVEFLNKLHERFFVVYHNAQYDREIAVHHGVVLQPFPHFSDTQVLDYMLDVNNKRHGLKHLSKTYLKQTMVEINELFGGSDHINFDLLPASAATVYCTADATQTLNLFFFYANHPHSPSRLQPVPLEIDLKMESVLRSMYRCGAPVNITYAYNAICDCLMYSKQVVDSICDMAGRHIDVGSSAQISDLLFKQFKLPPLPNEEPNAKGQYSTKEEVLDKLFELYPDFPILRKVILYRKISTCISKIFGKYIANSFVDDLLPNARVQFSFSQTNVPTGRLSSNSSGQRSRVQVKTAKTGTVSYVYHKDSWEYGGNSQGITNSNFRHAKAKHITALPAWAEMDVKNVYPQEIHEDLIKAVAGL